MVIINSSKNNLTSDLQKLSNHCTVLMSTYNGEKFVYKQIYSILNQKEVNVRLVIRDDGSTDNTISIVESIISEYPEKLTLLRGENVGIHKSFYQLIAYTKCDDFICFADQDDLWDLDKLIIAIGKMKENNAHFYSCSSRLVDENLNPTGYSTSSEPTYNFYMKGNSKILTPGCQGCTMVITNEFKNLLLKRGIPDYYGHDTWITVIAYYLVTSIYDPDSHMSYRQHDNSWTGNRTKRIRQLFVESKYYFKGLKRYKPLSRDVIEKYSDLLDAQDIDLLFALSSNEMNLADRLKKLCRYKFGKKGLIANTMFRIYYLFCW